MNQSVIDLLELLNGSLARPLVTGLSERHHRRLLSMMRVVSKELEAEDLLRTSSAGKKAIAIARKRYEIGSDDNLEIDEMAKILSVDAGYWVESWVWVDKESLVDGSELVCAHCGSDKVMCDVEQWNAVANHDHENKSKLQEHQCQECGKSMWT